MYSHSYRLYVFYVYSQRGQDLSRTGSGDVNQWLTAEECGTVCVTESAAVWTAAECSRLVRVVLIAAWAAARSALDTLGSRATWRRHASCHSWSRPAPPALLTSSPSSLLHQYSFLQTRFMYFRFNTFSKLFLQYRLFVSIANKEICWILLCSKGLKTSKAQWSYTTISFVQTILFHYVGTQRFIKIELKFML